MSVVYIKYLPFILVAIGILAFIQISFELKFYRWVKMYWFYKKKFRISLSSSLKLIGFSMLLLSLMDFRGEEEKTKLQVADQKTIILIDTSASMLAEDIRPNRFKKALILARHFIKQAYGHQVSVLVFSDTHKRLVPFTDDFDLLESRVAALEDLDLKDGGSNLSQAIFESLAYFSEISGEVKSPQGNILVFTDSEENGEHINITKDLKNINLAIVGIGTAKGAPIPVRYKDGRFQGNKKYNGQEVISKLDENQMKSYSKVFKNFKYWIALSYSIPTDEVLNFFRDKVSKGAEERDHVTKPVKMHYIVLPALFLILASFVLKWGNAFKRIIILLILAFSFNSYPQEDEEDAASKLRQKFWEENAEQLNKLEKGSLSRIEVLKLGEKALRSKVYDDANFLYNGVSDIDGETDDLVTLFNHATAKLADKKVDEASDLIEKFNAMANRDGSEEAKEHAKKLRENVLLAINQKLEDQAKQEESEKKNQQQKKDGDQSQNGKGQSDQDKDDNKGKGKEGKEKEEKQTDNEKKSDKNKDGNEKEKKQSKSESRKEREDRIRKEKKLVKVPSLLKQLLNEDRDLQKKNIDPRTNSTKWEQGPNGKKIDQSKKDW